MLLKKKKSYLQLSRQLQMVSCDKKVSLRSLLLKTWCLVKQYQLGACWKCRLYPTLDLLIQSLNFNKLSKCAMYIKVLEALAHKSYKLYCREQHPAPGEGQTDLSLSWPSLLWSPYLQLETIYLCFSLLSNCTGWWQSNPFDKNLSNFSSTLIVNRMTRLWTLRSLQSNKQSNKQMSNYKLDECLKDK